MSRTTTGIMLFLSSALAVTSAWAQPPNPRLREVIYDPHVVVTVPVKRGVVSLIVLASDESIVELASGLGSDCSRPEATWCVAAQPGGRTIFVKPKAAADEANTLAVVTDKRSHSFRLVVLSEGDPVQPVYRLQVTAPPSAVPAVRREAPAAPAPVAIELPDPPQADLLAARLKALPPVVNAAYSLAEGVGSSDIVPSLVFDDGRFTYFRFPGNGELPAVFHVLGDASETLVNTRMEGDLLVVDRVSRHLTLRAGQAVVGIWNDAFDLDGRPPTQGTTVPGVARAKRGAGDSSKVQP